MVKIWAGTGVPRPARDETAKYYLLVGHTTKLYVDGTNQIDYPDFISLTLDSSVPQLFYQLIKDGTFSCKAGVGVSFAELVDRYGQIYFSASPSVGLGVSLGSYSEGYIDPAMQMILDKDSLRKAIIGFNDSGCISFFGGFCVEFGGDFTGRNSAIVYSLGMQFGGSLSPTYTGYLYTDPSLGWDWTINGRVNGVFRDDVARKAM
jgi:hypothetical protein